MEHLTAVRIPGREWARAAVEDLAGSGCRAALWGGPDPEGCFTVLIRGPLSRVMALRQASEPGTRLCWVTLVNQVIAS